jgi:hypothetical protein
VRTVAYHAGITYHFPSFAVWEKPCKCKERDLYLQLFSLLIRIAYKGKDTSAGGLDGWKVSSDKCYC